MFKLLIPFLLVFSFQSNISAQDKNVDARAALIPQADCASVEGLATYIKQNFSTDTARVRAIFVWIANHINYDHSRLKAREKNQGGVKQTLAGVLSSRMAVCQGYAELFVALCKDVGIEAIFVPGYTKMQGIVNTIPHAWVAAELNGNWYLFDPTWGAGYIRDEQYVRKFNNSFYKMLPATAIADHMPFDPMFQFLSNPITHREFAYGTQATHTSIFNFRDSLKLYNQLSPTEQAAAELRRLEASGIQNDLLKERQLYLKTRLKNTASKSAFEAGDKAFAEVRSVYNEYIGFKNSQFNNITDQELKQMVVLMEQGIIQARSILSSAVTITPDQQQAKANNLGNMDRFWQQLAREKQFVDKYLATGKEARKQLFMKK